jgi:hypothetical protein
MWRCNNELRAHATSCTGRVDCLTNSEADQTDSYRGFNICGRVLETDFSTRALPDARLREGQAVQHLQSCSADLVAWCLQHSRTLQRFTAATLEHSMNPPVSPKPEWQRLLDDMAAVSTEE